MNNLDNLINEYKKTRTVTTRTRYPKIQLHPKFEQVLDLQIAKLRREGLDDKKITERLQRAMPFYVHNEE